jgi:cell division protein FtsQ
VRIIPKDIGLLFVSRKGELYPLVTDGTFLPPILSQQAPDVALLEGEGFFKSVEMRKKALQLISEVPHDGRFSKKNISQIGYDPKEGFWVTLLQSGLRVKLGEEQFATKAARISQVIEYMDARQLEARVIDANLSKKVLVRLRKDP